MHRETTARRRPPAAALLAASAAGLAAFAFVAFVMRSAPVEPEPIVALIRERGLLDDRRSPPPEAIFAALLSHERLRQVCQQAGLKAGDSQAIEAVRKNLRIDLADADEAGIETIAVRWMGAPSEQAVQIVNALARCSLEVLARASETPYESSQTSAERAVRDASRGLSDAHQRMSAAVARAHARRVEESPPVAPPPHTPTLAPRQPIYPDQGARLLLTKQLADFESRRLALSDRLMPEHPEMKALDERIMAVRSRLARLPYPEVAEGPPSVPQRSSPVAPSPIEQEVDREAAELAGLSAELLAAEEKYAAAVDHERNSLNQLRTARSRRSAEIEPAKKATVLTAASWQTWFAAAVSGLLTTILVFLVWPARRSTFSTLEEVRAVTQLPVIALSRVSLN